MPLRFTMPYRQIEEAGKQARRDGLSYLFNPYFPPRQSEPQRTALYYAWAQGWLDEDHALRTGEDK